MTNAALITLVLAWTVIASFTIYFFLKVLKTPQEKE